MYDEFNGEDVRTFGHLGLRALYEIATMPEESREQPHTNRQQAQMSHNRKFTGNT